MECILTGSTKGKRNRGTKRRSKTLDLKPRRPGTAAASAADNSPNTPTTALATTAADSGRDSVEKSVLQQSTGGSRPDHETKINSPATYQVARQPRQVVTGKARQHIIDKFRAKRPAYSNCRMLARDGADLASCDLKKLQWYVSKGLAEWVDGSDCSSAQPTIRLNFEHKQVHFCNDSGNLPHVRRMAGSESTPGCVARHIEFAKQFV